MVTGHVAGARVLTAGVIASVGREMQRLKEERAVEKTVREMFPIEHMQSGDEWFQVWHNLRDLVITPARVVLVESDSVTFSRTNRSNDHRVYTNEIFRSGYRPTYAAARELAVAIAQSNVASAEHKLRVRREELLRAELLPMTAPVEAE